MANMTAAQLVRRVRELLQVFGDADAYRDGFSSDSDTTNPTSILQGINEFLLLLQPTCVRVGETTIATVIGTATYDMALTVGEIFSVEYNGLPLRPTTVRSMNERNPGWKNEAAGTPQKYIREGATLRLFPKPSAVGTVTVNSTLPVPIFDGTTTTTQLSYVPEQHQRFVPYGAAVILAVVDAENRTHILRRDQYKAYAAWMLLDLARVCRPQDFDTIMSLDTFQLPQQFAQEGVGRYDAPVGSYAPILAASMPNAGNAGMDGTG